MIRQCNRVHCYCSEYNLSSSEQQLFARIAALRSSLPSDLVLVQAFNTQLQENRLWLVPETALGRKDLGNGWSEYDGTVKHIGNGWTVMENHGYARIYIDGLMSKYQYAAPLTSATEELPTNILELNAHLQDSLVKLDDFISGQRLNATYS